MKAVGERLLRHLYADRHALWERYSRYFDWRRYLYLYPSQQPEISTSIIVT